MRYSQLTHQTADNLPKTYSFGMEAHQHEVDEIRAWLKESIVRPYFASQEKDLFYVHFLDEIDSTHFKLRFCSERIDP